MAVHAVPRVGRPPAEVVGVGAPGVVGGEAGGGRDGGSHLLHVAVVPVDAGNGSGRPEKRV